MQRIYRRVILLGLFVFSVFLLTSRGNKQEQQLLSAIQHGDSKQVHSLLLAGVNPNATVMSSFACEAGEELALVSAVCRNDDEIVKMLLAFGADVNRKQRYLGITPLMTAAEKGNLKIMRLLLERGAVVNATDEDSRTALMFTSKKEAVDLLLKHGADPNIQASTGMTALALATSQKNDAIADLLRKAGALK